MEKKFEFIDVINAMERVKLAPLILPCLKMVDPIAREIPEGIVKEYLTHIRPREGQFRFLEKLMPYLPGIIKWAGKIASIKPLMVVFAIVAEVLAFMLKIIMPGFAAGIRLVNRLVGMVKKIFIGLKR
ncbi:MAG: hypothetical protein KJ737_10800 [Proteobacteria bacterium]|nr:hypothetical protein [Pseudomonadota bacterium]